MRIECKCKKCGKELNTNINLNTIGDLIIEVIPCGNIDCYDCSECEVDQNCRKIQDEVYNLKDENARLENNIIKLKNDMITSFTALGTDAANIIVELENNLEVKKGQTNLDGKNIPKI